MQVFFVDGRDRVLDFQILFYINDRMLLNMELNEISVLRNSWKIFLKCMKAQPNFDPFPNAAN